MSNKRKNPIDKASDLKAFQTNSTVLTGRQQHLIDKEKVAAYKKKNGIS